MAEDKKKEEFAVIDITEEYLKEALDCYHSIHGVYATIDNYIIFFEPSFTVMKTVGKEELLL